MHKREAIEVCVILAVAASIIGAHHQWGDAIDFKLLWIVVLVALFKTAYYFAESLWHLVQAQPKTWPIIGSSC